MKLVLRSVTAVLLVGIALLAVDRVLSAQQRRPDTPKVIRMYGDAKGETHLETIAVPLDARTGRWDGLPTSGNVQIARFAADLKADWHTGSRRTYLVTLSGAGYEIEVREGSKAQFPPGGILLVEDVKTKGHRTRALGETFVMYVPVDGAAR